VPSLVFGFDSFSIFLVFLRAVVNKVFFKAQILGIPTRMTFYLFTVKMGMT